MVLRPQWKLPPPKEWPPILERLGELAQRGRAPMRTVISEGYQQAYHERSGVNTDTFQSTADPSFIANMVSICMAEQLHLGSRRTGGTYGAVHVADDMELLRPLRFDEPLVITLGDAHAAPHPKGTVSTFPVSVTDASGALVMRLQRQGLELRPGAPRAKAAPQEAGRAVDPRAGRTRVSSTEFTPDMVGGYCWHGTNRIHSDVETATAFGYPAPIWSGIQGMHLTMAALYSLGVPQTLRARFTFRRPVFWTDTVELWAPADMGARGGVGEYSLLFPSGKEAMSMVVEAATFLPRPRL